MWRVYYRLADHDAWTVAYEGKEDYARRCYHLLRGRRSFACVVLLNDGIPVLWSPRPDNVPPLRQRPLEPTSNRAEAFSLNPNPKENNHESQTSPPEAQEA